VVISNRVSVPSGDGAKRAGGLEVALRPALQHNGGVWLGWSGKVGAPGQLETRSVKHKNVEYVVTDLSKVDFQEYYNGFANRVLWPILHYRLDLAEFARREQYLALESTDRRYDLGARYGLLTAQLALALHGRDRQQVLADLVELLAVRELASTAQ